MHFNLIKLAQDMSNNNNNTSLTPAVGAGLSALGLAGAGNYISNRLMASRRAPGPMPNAPEALQTAEQFFGQGNVPGRTPEKLQKMINTLQGDISSGTAQQAAIPIYEKRIAAAQQELNQWKPYQDYTQNHQATLKAHGENMAKYEKSQALYNKRYDQARFARRAGLAGAGALGLYAGYKGIQALRNRSNNSNVAQSNAV